MHGLWRDKAEGSIASLYATGGIGDGELHEQLNDDIKQNQWEREDLEKRYHFCSWDGS